MATIETAWPGAEQYVLCKRSARDALFACGADPLRSAFDKDGLRARRFPSVADALAYRAGLPQGEARECAVFQLMPDGRLVPPEAAEPLSLWGRNGGGARYPSSDAPSGAGRRRRVSGPAVDLGPAPGDDEGRGEQAPGTDHTPTPNGGRRC